MTGAAPFRLEPLPGGRSLRVVDDTGEVVRLNLGVPGETLPGWEPDDENLLATAGDDWEARLRLFVDVETTSLHLTLDNRAGQDRPTPPLGLAVTTAPGWAGWAWASDTEGFLLVSPVTGDGRRRPTLALRLRQGFLRAAQDRPAFTSEPRPDALFGAPALPPGCAAFHLADPRGAVGPHRAHHVVLALSALARPDDAAAFLPDWLPELVSSAGDEVRFATPDLAIVPGRDASMVTDDTAVAVTSSSGHREVAVHGVRGVQRLRVSWVPSAPQFLTDLSHALASRRPSAVSSATGVVVAEALARRAVIDPDPILDWLEREDWLAREDLFGVGVAAVLAVETHDERLLADAWRVLGALPVRRGHGLVTMRLWLASLTAVGAAPDLAGGLLARPTDDPLARLEQALLSYRGEDVWGPAVEGMVNRLGGRLPGQPMGMPASEAALLVSLLRLCPEGWAIRTSAAATAQKAAGLLLADYADGLQPEWDGLAWLLLGELGA